MTNTDPNSPQSVPGEAPGEASGEASGGSLASGLERQSDGLHPAPPFSLFAWDEKSNPFADLLNKHRPNSAPTDDDPDRNDEVRCLKILAEAFAASVMAGTPSRGPDETARIDEARRHWHRRVLRLSARTSQGDMAGDSARIATGRAPLSAAPVAPGTVSWEHLVRSYPWQRTPRQPVTLWESPRFLRPFSAVGPGVSMIFAAPSLLRAGSPISAAPFVHELGHIEDGQILGWRTFQSRDAEAVEKPALSAELRFLQSRLEQGGDVAWKDSLLRLEWNQSYSQTPWSTAEEAMTYLNIMDVVDPL